MEPRNAQSRLSRMALLIAFAFAIMGDPASSVAYAIEACLRALRGDLQLLIATMALVVGVVAVIDVNYHHLIERFPRGGGGAAAAAHAFGEGWAFLPLGSLIVDYALTIAIGVSAGSAAIIAYAPSIASLRVPMALGLAVVVSMVTWFGHGGRAIFAVMTLAFVAIAGAVLVHGFVDPVSIGAAAPAIPAAHGLGSVLFAFPVGMALATGTEAPSSAIAQLRQLDDPGRARFGGITIWLTLGIVGTLTIGLAVLAVRLHAGIPAVNSTQIATIAADAVGRGGFFAAFQLASALLLLSAANSGFNAGSGLLQALALPAGGGREDGILPAWLRQTNRHHTPVCGVAVFLVIAGGLVLAADGHDQVLVLFYAVAVFLSFLFGLLAMTKISWREGQRGRVVLHGLGIALVVLTLVVDVVRVDPIASLLGAGAVGGLLYLRWVRAGRPRGVVPEGGTEAGEGAVRIVLPSITPPSGGDASTALSAHSEASRPGSTSA